MIDTPDEASPAEEPEPPLCQGQRNAPAKKIPSVARVLQLYAGKHYMPDEWEALKASADASQVDPGRLMATIEAMAAAMKQAAPAMQREPFFFLLAAYLHKVYMPIFVDSEVAEKYRSGEKPANVRAEAVAGGKSWKIWLERTDGIILPGNFTK